MLKPILLFFLVLQVLSVQRGVKLSYYQQFSIPRLPQADTVGNLIINLGSLQGNDATIPITVDLRQIQDLNAPFTSVSVGTSQTCTFTDNKCSVAFTSPTINTAYKYVIEFSDASGTPAFHQFTANIQWSTARKTFNLGRNLKIFLSPLGVTKPGFKFYAGASTTWTTNFKLETDDDQTTPSTLVIDSYLFTLYSVSGNTLTQVDTRSATVAAAVSFDIASAGFYFLSVEPQVSAIDSTVRYPLVLSFKFEDNVCPAGQYFDKTSTSCLLCSGVTNAKGTTTIPGICDCNTDFYWNGSSYKCVACPRKGKCPNPPKKSELDVQFENQDFSQKGLQKIVDDFNNGNLSKEKNDRN